MNELIPINEQMKDVSLLSKEEITDFIFELENKLLEHPQTELPLQHYFADGIYGREILLPAGTLLTGRVHKLSTINFLIEGELSILSIEGYARVKAPAVIASPAGVKRLGFAHTDARFVTVVKSEKTDPEEIFEEVTTNDRPEILSEIKEIA